MQASKAVLTFCDFNCYCSIKRFLVPDRNSRCDVTLALAPLPMYGLKVLSRFLKSFDESKIHLSKNPKAIVSKLRRDSVPKIRLIKLSSEIIVVAKCALS
ncbi:hypothetical protein Plhal304r1_c019g0067051 [Plasmopara halstedii]